LNENKLEKEQPEQVVYTTYCNENGLFKVSNQDKQIMQNMKLIEKF